MKKNFVLVSFLLFSVSTQAQILEAIKSTVKEKTGIDLNKPVKATNSTTTTPTSTTTSNSSVNLSSLSSTQISSGLKEALNLGVTEGVKKLSTTDGFYKNEMVKILMPEKLRVIDTKLRAVGLGSLADQGVKLLNRAAEDAVTSSAPIFANAITSMTITDAKNILLGSNNAATNYLQTKTQNQLFTAFQPKVKASLGKVGADTVWKNLISKYNLLTGQSVTTDLNEYVTTETINGVFKMIAEKESGIRNNPALRTTSLLQKVFGAK
ncbi:DUF4197 domain-containing protein [Chryseobacterium daecheongense]|uniref:DUF4197 domain-containing protein n=1 Tax=Chryseobacterium daecheongense TaxID=192389 RepID=A0A3N0VZ39_9FLAO|nr:DUF4197 domain-containing protein [Chryseobacterium daecheongense]ROH98073.1 DUF4197 domain-containing protein [Chryseobacterium daecheongense]TDX92728.1 uncharacterized protein DUF4197 [Chryseobacterium daecheongense]UOU98051.1 DUF4197 domain-containing protein [Chryseobacterium daecheongense]